MDMLGQMDALERENATLRTELAQAQAEKYVQHHIANDNISGGR